MFLNSAGKKIVEREREREKKEALGLIVLVSSPVSAARQ